MENTEKASVITELQQSIPQEMQIEMPALSGETKDEKIESANEKTRLSLLKILQKSEDARLKQQKPVLYIIGGCVLLQLIFFNVVMAMLVWQWWGTEDTVLATALLDFLKYYIGAVVVELVGMLVFITRSAFTSNSKKIIERILPPNSKNE